MAKIFAIIISIFSISAFATMDCASGHRFESYSLGTTQIFGLDIEKPLINDDYCWRLGELAAENIYNHHQDQGSLDRCQESYEHGFDEGFIASQRNARMPNDCYFLGLNAGHSYLSDRARSNDVEEAGQQCVKAYIRGKDDALNNRPMYSSSNNKINHCYRTGYFDGQYYYF